MTKKHPRGLPRHPAGTVLPIVIIVLALVLAASIGGLLYVYKKEPKATTTNTVTNVNATVNTNSTNANTNTTVATNANTSINTNSSSDKASTDVTDEDNANVHIYTSYKLGVRFRYWSSTEIPVTIVEQENRIYVRPKGLTEGQWVEVHAKSSEQTLTEAITEDFLKGIDPQHCYAEESTNSGRDRGEVVVINFPHSGGLEDPSWGNRERCPSEYTVTNGALYFWTDDTPTDKYVFFSIGQYYIGGIAEMTPWQHSLEFID